MMRGTGVILDVISFNAAISASEKKKQREQAWAVLQVMRGQCAYVNSFNAAMSACAKRGQWEQARVSLQVMRDRSM
eukprot:2797639-Karenia_brevis.AAC.1